MPDHPVIPRQFRDALNTFAAVVRGHYTGPFPSAASEARGLEAMKAARAEVERLYAARVGEEYEVAFIQPDCGDPTVPEYRAEWGMVLHGTMPVWLHPDQRVRVSRIPAGDMTGEAP